MNRPAVILLGLLIMGALVQPANGQIILDEFLHLPYVVKQVPLLYNDGFELEQWQDARWWEWPWHQFYTGQFDEVRPGVGWTAWWVESKFCPHNESYRTGRPEVLVIDIKDGLPDPGRVYSGDRALKWFTFWRCHQGGVYQQVAVPQGTYQASAHAVSWYTECSSITSGPPRNRDCQVIGGEWVWAKVRIGIDPEGGTDYWSDDIEWSDPVEVYDVYTEIKSPEVYADDGAITVWIMSETSAPLKHEDLYLDEIMLVRR